MMKRQNVTFILISESINGSRGTRLPVSITVASIEGCTLCMIATPHSLVVVARCRAMWKLVISRTLE
jgi:hypothetical protein